MESWTAPTVGAGFVVHYCYADRINDAVIALAAGKVLSRSTHYALYNFQGKLPRRVKRNLKGESPISNINAVGDERLQRLKALLEGEPAHE
jgi:hypothetical protein